MGRTEQPQGWDDSDSEGGVEERKMTCMCLDHSKLTARSSAVYPWPHKAETLLSLLLRTNS